MTKIKKTKNFTMLNKVSTILIYCLISLFFISTTLYANEKNQKYKVIEWKNLVPKGFSMEDIYEKYKDQINALSDTSPGAQKLFNKMMNELNNGPLNVRMDKKWIKLPGFIAPLSQEDDVITEFLFVPYFGACIHTPPPPINQTIYVKSNKENGITLEDSYLPFWLKGQIQVKKNTTELAEAGYLIENPLIALYEVNN